MNPDQLAWARYLEAPAEVRLIASWDDMPVTAKEFWLDRARQAYAAGWRPEIPETEAPAP